MADIELLIKIDEEQYEFIKQSMTIDKVKDYHALLYDICKHIKNGTPLPEGHGKLIDADALIKEKSYCTAICLRDACDNCQYKCVAKYDITNAPTIIEAESEE